MRLRNPSRSSFLLLVFLHGGRACLRVDEEVWFLQVFVWFLQVEPTTSSFFCLIILLVKIVIW